jgi:threonylcarbamoyladenosine tRNA methylthiotransferase MtaB
MEAIMADIQRAEAWGTQEVVLTGVQLGGYGREWGSESSLSELLLQILRQSEIPRIRLSSLEPWGLSPEFFELWGDPRLCRHLHLPLQSGCGEVLRRMGRPITPAEYAEVVYQARTHIPGLAITTDLIVGFPGESDRAFEESLAFVEQMSFARAHVFPFSPRAGTAAAKLGDPVPQNLIRERSERMRKTVGISTRAFQGRFIGECLPVLWEGRIARTGADVLNQGYSDNYIRVEAIASTPLHNTITPVRLLHAGECGLVGVVEQSPGECGP